MGLKFSQFGPSPNSGPTMYGLTLKSIVFFVYVQIKLQYNIYSALALFSFTKQCITRIDIYRKNDFNIGTL